MYRTQESMLQGQRRQHRHRSVSNPAPSSSLLIGKTEIITVICLTGLGGSETIMVAAINERQLGTSLLFRRSSGQGSMLPMQEQEFNP